MNWRRSLPYFAVVAAIAILATLYYRATALTNLIPIGYDIFTYFYPNEAYGAEALRQGRLPLWNPYLFTGVPFLANSQTAIFYPPNLLFLITTVPRAYVYSVLLHVILAGCSMYAFSRHTLSVDRISAMAAAGVFMFGGFTGGLFGHLNQLQVVAWAPLVLLFFERSYRQQRSRWALASAIVIGLQALAGHTQGLYLTLVTLGLFFGLLLVSSWPTNWHRAIIEGGPSSTALSILSRSLSSGTSYYVRQVARFGVAVVAGFGLAAIQLLPTAELSTLSIRSGGMSFEEAASFSLPPWMLLKAMFPVYGQAPIFSEWLGYIGVAGLLLSALAVAQRPRNRYVIFFTLLAILSAILALGSATPLFLLAYKFVPGVDLFRVPARWLFPYTLAMASLVALGLNSLNMWGAGLAWKRPMARFVLLIIAMAMPFVAYTALGLQPVLELPEPITPLAWAAAALLTVLLIVSSLRPSLRRFAATGLTTIVLIELFAAGLNLELNRPNLPEAFTTLRPSITHFLADPGLYRILATADNTYDPGDLAEMKAIVGQVLPPEGVYDYVVAAKLKETMAPNLPLLHGIATLDGYDGGALPLKRYVEFKSLFSLAQGEGTAARFREQINAVPPSSLLAWLNVKYFVMDRVNDIWVDGVYYDLGINRQIQTNDEITLNRIKPFATTSLGIASYLEGCTELPQGSEVATVTVVDTSGATYQATIRAGIDSAEGHYVEASSQRPVAHDQPQTVGHLKSDPNASVYLGKFTLPALFHPKEITIRSVSQAGEVHLCGLSLIDDRVNLSQPVAIDNALRIAQLGDVKIYENLEVAPRAFLVDRIVLASDDEKALSLLKSEALDPLNEAVVLAKDWEETYGPEGGDLVYADRPDDSGGEVSIISYEPERVEIEVSAERLSLLVITDSYYPGWRVRVDGHEQPIVRTDHLFRGVMVEPGQHKIEFTYEPTSFGVGAGISLITLVLTVGIFLLLGTRAGQASETTHL